LHAAVEREPAFDVAEYAGAYQAIAGIADRRPGIAMIDEELHGLSGQSLAALLLRDLPDLKVIELVTIMDFDHLNDAVRCGASTALPRDVEDDTAIEHIRAVIADEFRFHPWPVQQLDAYLADGHDPRRAGIEHTLTLCQAAVLDGMLAGLNAGEMTRALGLSNYALRKETQALFAALGVDKKVGAIAVALERRWSNVGRRTPTVTVARPAEPSRPDPGWSFGANDQMTFHRFAEATM
jgi:DNA-binding NarL/FixJ family response regulator